MLSNDLAYEGDTNVVDYSSDVEVDDGLAAGGRFEEGKVLGVSWKKGLTVKDCKGKCKA